MIIKKTFNFKTFQLEKKEFFFKKMIKSKQIIYKYFSYKYKKLDLFYKNNKNKSIYLIKTNFYM